MREGAKERVERKWVGVGVVMSTGPGILGASQGGGGMTVPGPRVLEPTRGPPEKLFRLRIRSVGTPLPS